MSWYGLLSIYQDEAEIQREARSRPPVSCPNDGTLLQSGPDGSLWCKWDGYQWPRDGGDGSQS